MGVHIQGLKHYIQLTDGTDTHTIKAVQEPGLGGRLSIGLDETARMMVICDVEDIDVDFGLGVATQPTISIRNASNTNYYSNITMDGITTGGGPFTIKPTGGFRSILRADLASGNVNNFSSDANIELTDTDGEQSWLYVEPKINQSATGAYNALQIKVTETATGDGSTGTGATNNLFVAGTSANSDMFKFVNDGDVAFTATDDFTITSATSGKPTLKIEGTNTGASPMKIQFYKNTGASAADNDEIGNIQYTSKDDGSNDFNYADIFGFINDASNGDEAGRWRVRTAIDASLRNMLDIRGNVGSNTGEVTINEDGQDVDTRIEASGQANALFVEGSSGDVYTGNSLITVGSGTGITVNRTGHLNRQIYKVTTTYDAYADTDTTKGIVIATLPAKMKIVGCYADTTTPYTGGAVSAATLEVGITVEGAAEIIAAHDVLSGAVTKGLADADMGTSMTRAAAIQGGYLPSWTGTTAIYATIDTTTANTDALTAGSTTFYIETEQM
jgi:hypothetical protein